MFYGSHSITMDSKGRLALPTKVREELAELCGGNIVLTAHTEERCVLLFPEPQWVSLVPQLQALPTMSKTGRKIQRLMLGNASPMECDNSGRIVVPPTLRDYASMEKKLLLVGQGEKFELWSEAGWNEWLEKPADDEIVPDAVANLIY